jgi:hypothetical protein
MTVEQRVYDISLDAASDLSAKKFYLAKGSGTFGCDLAGAASEDLLGPIQNAPESGQAAEIRILGISKVECGGTISIWDKVTSDANGKAVTAADGERYCGLAMEAGVSGRIIAILMEHGYVEMT